MSVDNILVSIIVPVYGTEEYLSDCINSLCNQSHSCIEFILVDDQSPDRCPEICDTYAKQDSRIKVIHQKNKGVSGARNTGLDLATGDYIVFVDSDDELYSQAIEQLLQDAVFYEADIVSAVHSLVDGQGNIIRDNGDGVCEVFRDDEAILLSLKGNINTNSVWAKIFRSEFIKDIRFEEGKNINEDGYFMFQCFVRRPVLVQHNVAVYKYSIRQNSCSRQKYSDKYLSMFYFMDRKKEYIKAHYPQYIDQAYNMEIRTLLFFLDILCSDTESKNKSLQNQCIKRVRELRKYHIPINKHHKQLEWIVVSGLYPIYKILIRIKYYR